ncbi:jerky protein homolog-like [Topomyia yanbarensis]|uniref:jerky protein homolog-like n=1 Tax=Topomyia yanbarensis TaxID=2498891 RepID=UPI00273A818F|nr:jerky protein homolog-like [Topomyia yanbarensis]
MQAKKLFSQIYGKGLFLGSRGYILKFIKRHNIRFLKITGEKLSNDIASVDAYVNKFSTVIRQKALNAAQIFNADESGLYYKCTPSSTFVAHDETSAPGRKVNKERVTFMPCSNADGSFKLPLMLIGKSKKPRVLKNVHELPVYYVSSKNAWMTRALFKDWFFQQFVPKVKVFLQSTNLPLKAILVLDNCSAHCNCDELKTSDGAFSTILLPPNTTAVLQPMDQNIIQMVKANYRQKLMRDILGRQGEFDENVKRINLKDAIFWVAEAWDAVPAESIAKSWNLLYREPEFDNEDNLPLSVIKDRLLSIQRKIEEHENIIEDENAEFDVMSDADIVNAVLNPDKDFYDAANTTLDETADTSAVPVSDYEENSHAVSDESALNSMDTIITWAEENRMSIETQFYLPAKPTSPDQEATNMNSTTIAFNVSKPTTSNNNNEA